MWPVPVSVRFGRFAFDESSRELRCEGRNVPLSPKAFDFLAARVREWPRALSKSELRDRLWPDTVVGETSLPRLVGEVRRALGETQGGATCIRTVQRFGYAFVGEIEGSRAGPSERGLALLWGNRIIPLETGDNLVGRDPACALAIPWGLVSRQHARVVVGGGRAVLHDLGSKNGTLLQGKRIQGAAELADGDEIRIGPARLVFCAPPAGSTRRS